MYERKRQVRLCVILADRTAKHAFRSTRFDSNGTYNRCLWFAHIHRTVHHRAAYVQRT